MLDFSDQQVLVVGGSGGIGNGIAQAFRRAGASVQVWGTRAQADDYAAESGSDLAGLDYVQADLSDDLALANVPHGLQRLNVLVLAQGTVLYGRGEFAMPGWQQVMQVNLSSMMACAAHFHPMLGQSSGCLITVSSTSGYRSTLGNPAYNASKAGLIGLTRTLGEAWARDGIRVNGIAPGLVDTKLTRITTENPERLERALRQIPMRRMGTPEDMAGVALFLASPLASYVLGQTIVVDGGLILS